METKIIDGYEIKDHCVKCGKWIGFHLSNYQVRGNFCSECNSGIINKIHQEAHDRFVNGETKHHLIT